MTDDKSKRDFRDRDRVAAEEEWEVAYFARQNGITIFQTRELIRKFGNMRETLEREAKKLK